MQTISRAGYTREEILSVLHAQSHTRQIRFRYNLLDKDNNFIRELDNVTEGEVSMTALATIKRTATFRLVENDKEIDYLTNKIQPIMEVKIPEIKTVSREVQNGKYVRVENVKPTSWVAFPLGVFHLSTPVRKDEQNKVYREIEAYDGLIVLDEDKFTERYFIAGGTSYVQAVKDLLTDTGITKYNIEDNDALIGENGLEFAVGDSKLSAINKLLSSLNFTPIWVDANGYYTTQRYVSPVYRAPEYDYVDNELSITYNGLEEEFDMFAIPNVWVAVQTNPEKEPLTSTKVNDDPASPTSTVSLGRNVVDYREIDDVADQQTLDAYVDRIALEATQVYQKIKFQTALMPFHEYSDCVRVRYSALDLDDKFVETNWKMKLAVGGKMEHEARKVVVM